MNAPTTDPIDIKILRLKVADCDRWREVAMRTRAETDELAHKLGVERACAEVMAAALNAMRERVRWCDHAFTGADEQALANVTVRKGLTVADAYVEKP